MALKDAYVGDEVTITGVIVRQDDGQTLIWFSGIGGSGCWSVASTAECEVRPASASLLRRALQKGAFQPRETP